MAKKEQNDDPAALNLQQLRNLVITELKRKSRVRLLLRDCSSDEISDMGDRLLAIAEERRSEERAAELHLESIKTSVGELQESLKANPGLSKRLAEAFTDVNGEGMEKAAAKYFRDGVYWSGRGRRPKKFVGLSKLELEKYRIPNSQFKGKKP